MKKYYLVLLILLISVFITSISYAKTVKVKGGVTKSGKYRMPSYRTSPNKTKLDNWSTKGNVNPYTGKKGTVNPHKIK